MSLSRPLSWLVARAAYPGLLLASVLAADAALARGVPGLLVSSISFVAVLLAVAALEHILPFDPASNPDLQEAREDALYLALASVLQPLGKLGGRALATAVTLALSSALAAPSWPPGWSPWGKVVAALLTADLAKYWVHRLAHERPWWWRFHAEHHAPARLYSLNGIRLHPINLLWNLALDTAPALVFGLDPRSIVLVAVLRGAVAALQHANVDLRLGPLRWVFSTPDLHRWHHSAELREASANYGSTLLLWDILFGTLFLSGERRAPASLGLAGGAPQPRGLRHELLWPWCASRADRCPQVRGWKPRGRRVAA
jgi:sterol desaturase/sphingolipid hydroxylase (fatty acid hydroxylase superfamily)